MVDAKFEAITEPAKMEMQINNIPGVLGERLFVGLADEVLVVRSTGIGLRCADCRPSALS